MKNPESVMTRDFFIQFSFEATLDQPLQGGKREVPVPSDQNFY